MKNVIKTASAQVISACTCLELPCHFSLLIALLINEHLGFLTIWPITFCTSNKSSSWYLLYKRVWGTNQMLSHSKVLMDLVDFIKFV